MDVDLSLDEIIERKRVQNPNRPNDKKLHPVQMKPRKPLNKPGPHARTFDARNKIIQKTRAKIIDARDILNQNIRESGIDARNVLLERKKERMPMPMPPPPHLARAGGRSGGDMGGVHKGRFGQRTITMSNRAIEVIQSVWDPKKDSAHPGGYKSGGSSDAPYQSRRMPPTVKPFVPRAYVDYDNMQQLEDEEIARTLHLGSYNNPAVSGPRSRPHVFNSYDMDMDDVEVTSPAGNSLSGDPFAIYEPRNRVERPTMPPPPPLGVHRNNVDKLFDRRQRNLVASSNLPDSLRARLFGSEPDRRVSHGIYANENGSGRSKTYMDESVMPKYQRENGPDEPCYTAPGYRLLVSNLHAIVTTADIRELFTEIGPIYDARVVRPGTAEVIYKSLEHAELAVDTYHQREFDGQPMHCTLVSPHSSIRSSHSASSRTVTTNSSGVEVDIDALHSVLFRDR